MNKVVRVGKGEYGNIFCEINFSDDGILSITGVEGPMKNGNAKGSCGQIEDCITPDIDLAPKWTPLKVKAFLAIWKRWHLNDLTSGTPKQERFIRRWRQSRPQRYDYAEACEALKEAGLYDDDGYKYGTKWLREEVPPAAIRFLESLPGTDKTPAWV